MPSNLPSIPDIPIDAQSRNILEPMKETIEVITGLRKSTNQKFNAMPTWQELIDIGLITEDQVPT